MKAIIKAISYYLPEKIVTNEDLSKEFPEWSVNKISEKTGILERHIVTDDTCSSDIAILAAKQLFEEYNINTDDIDFLILCTQSPDYFLPTTACIIQKELGLPTTIGAFDFNLGCSGYIYGLSIAKGLIEAGLCRNLLFLTAETYSKFIDKRDKSVRTIFGDAASATLITKSDSVDEKIHSFSFGTDGRGADKLIVKNGGMRNRNQISESTIADEYGNISTNSSLYMDGTNIFVFTLKVVPKTLQEILDKAKMTMDDIDLFIFHQANKYMLDELRKKINIPIDKFYIYIEKCGNTVSSTIPIALYSAIKEKKIKNNSKVMLIGFGVGLSWGGCIVEI